ncbi:hypothetical protein [Fusobacterium varium]
MKNIFKDKVGVKLFITPRRFEKSSNIFMLKYFFDERERRK